MKPFFIKSRYTIAFAALVVLISVSVLFSDPVQDMLAGLFSPLSIDLIVGISRNLTNYVTGAIASTGYLGIFTLMLLEGTSLPIPSEVILPFAGYLVSLGRLDYGLTVLLATAAGVLGGLFDYYIGLFLGTKVISRYGSRFFISSDQISRIETLFERHGAKIVFLSRLIPGVRTLASFPAGSSRMNLVKFTVYTALGCLAFDSAFVYIGDYLGSHWRFIHTFGLLEIGAGAIVVIVGAWIFLRTERRGDR